MFAICQIVVFGTMAAYTSNFRILPGPSSDTTQSLPSEFRLNTTNIDSVFAANQRGQMLPVINARGISVTMGVSRLLLLIQYGFVAHSAPRTPDFMTPILWHTCTLLFSGLTYFITTGIISDPPTTHNSIVKIVLWFIPLAVEIACHFYLNGRVPVVAGVNDSRGEPDQKTVCVRYKPEVICKRSASLFIVILGTGLTQITGSFKYVVGAVGFSIREIAVIVSAAIIIIGEFSLYFRNNWKNWSEKSDTRTLLWFFWHYFYLATLILTLQAARSLLSFANLDSAINTLISTGFAMEKQIVSMDINGLQVTEDMFPQAEKAFLELGFPFGVVVDAINQGLHNPTNTSGWVPLNKIYIYIASVAFNEFDAFPQQGTPLYNQIRDFLENPRLDTDEDFILLGELFSSRLHPAFWFWGVSGGTLIMIAVMSLLKQRPADHFEQASIAVRFIAGMTFVFLSLLAIGDNKPYFTDAKGALMHFGVQSSNAWKVASSPWIIPIFGGVILLVNIIDIGLERWATSRYPTSDTEEQASSTPEPSSQQPHQDNEGDVQSEAGISVNYGLPAESGYQPLLQREPDVERESQTGGRSDDTNHMEMVEIVQPRGPRPTVAGE
ncbi:hypothetical protein JAAARDRAFT_613920 [Jaapia argillacea MUCL 33604]|uniref:Uncharacterized protein n=1 Tax=Jaapia argillacea MUCL 33604 TaxID=933084 RepID=A0A067PHL8_9AGAM|nr:hypothetical protein JAAARDRAFT_613920 [Jaapia argillacea MUCL 33604]